MVTIILNSDKADKPDMSRKIISWVVYPIVMISGIALHYSLKTDDVNILIATYVPVLFGALMITILELKFHHRKNWTPNKTEVGNDALYMAVVQVALPKIMVVFFTFTLLEYFSTNQIAFKSYWPHHYGIALQTVIMVLSAELFRYWLHRFSHEWSFLWRFHAVHHSPHKLYWVNVARFHPIDKALQFLFDALPFIIFGVSEEVLALYFVFYSINGFFQHCNIELRLGILNYIISGPELHRWHHSKMPKEANQNYGNNLIIWDLLFGSWFLPKDKLVADLGLNNRNYPLTFLRQLRAPFIKGLDQE